MAAKRTRRYRLTEAVARKVGPKKTYRVMLFIACWGICTERLGRPPASIDEYADWWHQHRASAFRDQGLFREVLPAFETPTEICAWLREQDPEVFKSRNEGAVAFRVGALL